MSCARYRRSLQCEGVDASVVFDLAHALAESGSLSTAVERYHQCVELDPTYAEAWANMGDCLVAACDMDGGIDAMQRAIDLDPGDAEYRFNLADALERAGDTSHAAVHFEAFPRRAHLDSGDAHVAHARRCVGGELADQGR